MARVGLLATWLVSLFGLGNFQGHDHGHTAHTGGRHANELTPHVVFLDQVANPAHRQVVQSSHGGAHVGHGAGGVHGDMHTHVDGPGEHGNNSPFAVIHRAPGGHDTQGSHGSRGTGDTHIDLTNYPFPVVHRDHGGGHGSHSPHGGHGAGEIHVDRPGEHGNHSPFPVVHRTGVQGHVPHGSPGREIHIDRSGEHGRNLPVAVVNRKSGTDHDGHMPHAGDVQADGRDHTGHVARLTIPLDRGFGDGRVPGGLSISSSIFGLSPSADRQIDRLIGPRIPLLGIPGGPIGLPPFSLPFRPGFMPPPPPGMRGPQPFGPFGPPFREFGPPPPFGGRGPRFMRRLRRRRIRRLLRERALSTGQTVPDLLESLLSSLVRPSTRG